MAVRTYVDGASSLRAEVLDSGNVRFELVAGKTAAVSASVLRQLADLAEKRKK